MTRISVAEDQNRFTSGFPTAPVPNASSNFLLSGFDLSGIGWQADSTNKSFALISPLHFIGATHFAPNTSDSVNFLGTDGTVRSFGVSSITIIKNPDNSDSDLFLGTLTQAIQPSDQIGFFPVARELEVAPSTSLYVFGKTQKVGTGTVGSFQDFASDPITAGSGLNKTRTYNFTYSTIAGFQDDAHFEIGDSGSPSFTVVNGQLAVTGTHSALVSTGSTFVNYDAFVPFYTDELNTAMAGSGYQVTNVPEPAAVAAILGLLALGYSVKRRRA